MTEGQGLAAASARATGTDAAPSADPVRPGPPPAAQPGPGPAAAGPAIPGGGEGGRHRRVDARQLEAALLALRRRIVDVNLVYETEGAEATRAERRKLLSQIDDYLLPRIRQSEAPILVALVGSTGAGKSTLVNSIVGAQVSATGIRRPTTNSPVLACHPDEADWFAENVFLPTVPRVRQEGLARSGRDGLLVLASSEGMPKGVALLDTPDIDSVVSAHRDFAHQFLDASDLWLFMTTATRYADAAVWELLEYAKERGAALGIVLSRVPPSSGAELTQHFGAMLEANGLGENDRFVINETVITDSRLPPEASAPVREWLQDTAVRADRRVAVLTQTMAGALDTFRSRVPALAAEVEAQLRIRSDLKAAVEGAYAAGLGEAEEALADGSLLRGEILARWQDFAGTGELLRGLQAPRGRQGRQRKRGVPARAGSLKSALRAGIESLILSVADRAAEESIRRWRNHPAGVSLLDAYAAAQASQSWTGSQFAADAGLIFGTTAEPIPDDGDGASPEGPLRQATLPLAHSSADLQTRAVRAVSAWQDHVMRLVKAESVTKRSIARVMSFDDDSLATVLIVAMLGQRDADGAPAEGTGAVPQLLLASLFGAGPLREIGAKARADLTERMRRLFDEEMLRFVEVIDSAGELDDAAAVRLYQATYSLEMAR
jgi:energy-coupling factor transporter ATP-binding protein EcfA2